MLILVIDRLFFVYMIMLFARIIASWIPELRAFRLMQFIGYYTDPFLNVFRRIIPPLGMIDISPIVAFLALGVLEHITKQIAIAIFY